MIARSPTRLRPVVPALALVAVLSLWVSVPVHAALQVQTTDVALHSKVAPGEFMPVSVKLLNFGSNNRIDVVLTYTITSADGATLYNSSETVAVETTASFVKSIQIPFNTTPGNYTIASSILYPGQVAPAKSEFPFSVEPKIFGLFQSDFYGYLGLLALVCILAALGGRYWWRRGRSLRLAPIDYSNIGGDAGIFYELISDTVMGMRQQVGHQALDIARNIEGLKIDERTGRVLSLTKKPSLIVAELVSEYEKVLGKKVSFSFRRHTY